MIKKLVIKFSLLALFLIVSLTFLLLRSKIQRGQSLPFKVQAQFLENSQEYKKVSSAIKYLNQSMGQEVFSLTEGSGNLKVNDEDGKFKDSCEKSLAIYDPWSHSIVFCPEYKKEKYHSFSNLVLAHELLHSLGILHNHKEFSLMNFGTELLKQENTEQFENLKKKMTSRDVKEVQGVLSKLPQNQIIIWEFETLHGFSLKY